MAKKKTISALPVWQPWAWLIVNGHKDVENRGWVPTDERIGRRFAIHAPKRRITKSEFEYFLKKVRERKIKRHPATIDDFEYGAIIGTAVLTGVSRSSKSPWAERGQFHWALESARKMKSKKIKRGMKSWFSVKL